MADPNYPYLSSNIKSLRRVYGEEQLDLANAIGLTIPAVSNYERGERIPKRDIIARIAKHSVRRPSKQLGRFFLE